MRKKLLFVSALVLLSIAAKAQSRLGVGFAYGTDVEEFGLNLNGEFFLKNDLAIAPDFTYFFAEDPVSFWTLNADIHYFFAQSNAAAVYGLAGLNLATLSVDRPGEDDSDTELGLNFGIGVNFDINASITPFTQLKFVISDFDQAVFGFGVRFNLR